MITGLVLFLAALLLRAASPNRHVKGRLLASAVAFAVYGLLATALRYGALSASLQEQMRPYLPLLLAFGIISSLVALTVNPWGVDRLPDRFPTIVQDAAVIGLFGFVATLLLQDKIFGATAAGAVVLGLALQGTLGNLFAGLAIQMEKPFRVGHWVRIADIDGQVSEVTWRATKVRTKAGNFVIVPNSKLADDIIINYSEPTRETRIEVEVGASYDTPPNEVKDTILAALKADPTIPTVRQPEVLLKEFASSAVSYRIWVWTTEFGTDEYVCDRIRSAVYYAFRRRRIEIPFPMQVEIGRTDPVIAPGAGAAGEKTLRSVSILAALSPQQHAELAAAANLGLHGAGEVIVRQGDAGSSMFVVVTGEVVVVLEPEGQEVARIGPGGFFGEMSLLTGAPRNATVRAQTDSELLEITVDAFRRFVLANPTSVGEIGVAVATRQAELEHRRAAGVATVPDEGPHSFVDRVRQFLGLDG